MPVGKVCRLQAIQELQKKNEKLQKEIEEKEKIIAAIKASIAANMAELEKLKKENNAHSIQEEPEAKEKECCNSRVSGSNRLRSSTISMFGKNEDQEPEAKNPVSKWRGYQSE